MPACWIGLAALPADRMSPRFLSSASLYGDMSTVLFSTGAPFASLAIVNLSRSGGAGRSPCGVSGPLPIAPNQVAQPAEHAAKVAFDVLAVAPEGGVDALGEPRERQGLQPDAARTGQRREEQPFPAE